jgi:hypothetical protein
MAGRMITVDDHPIARLLGIVAAAYESGVEASVVEEATEKLRDATARARRERE